MQTFESHLVSGTNHTSRTFLLVDDDENARIATGRLMSLLGWDVTTCSLVREAIAIGEALFDFDVILTDFQMPEATGADFIRYLRSSGETVRQ